MTPRVAIYTRISQDRLREELATDRQEESCRHYCAGRGWEVAGVYKDVDVSAYKRDVERPDYERLLNDIKAGRIDGVVVWKLDRLVRRITEFSRFWAVCDAAGAFVTASSQPLDTSDPMGLGMVFMLVGLAETESKTRSDRLVAKHAQLAKEGRGKGGGTRPFGFSEDRKSHRREEVKLIKEAANRVLQGEAVRSIAKDWTERGVSTVTGKPWSTTVLRSMLTSGRVAGLREHHGEIVRSDSNGEFVRAEWKPILDVDTHLELRSILEDPSRSKRGAPGRTYLLTRGLAFCALCDAKLVARPKGDGRPCYVCAAGVNFKGCGKIRQLAHPVEELVISHLFNNLDVIEQANRPDEAATDDAAEVEGALRTEQRALEQLARDHYVDGLISREEFFAARKPLQDRVEHLSARLLELERQAPPSFAELLDRARDYNLDDPDYIEDWRKVAEAALERVVIHPAVRGRNKFDPKRIEIVWKPEVDDLVWERAAS